jgi:hypothetical protein
MNLDFLKSSNLRGNLTVTGVISGNNLRTSFNQGSATGDYSFAEGDGTATGNYSHAEGYNTVASGDSSHAEGKLTLASGERSHAEGLETIASGLNSHAEGFSTTASGLNSHAEGQESVAFGDLSHAEGYLTTASNYAAHAEGTETIASGDSSHAEGYLTIASDNEAHAEGFGTKASGNSSHAEGEATVAHGAASHAAGYRATAAQNYTYAWSDGELGTLNTNISSTRTGQYMISASGGVFIPGSIGIGTDSIDNALTVVGDVSSTRVVYASGGNSNQWNNIITTYQSASSTFASKVVTRSYTQYSSGDYAVQQGRNVELSFSTPVNNTNVTITLPRQDTNDNAQSGDELLIRLSQVSGGSSTVTIRRYQYTGILPYLLTYDNIVTFGAGTPAQTIRLRLTDRYWSLLTTPNLFSPSPIGNVTPSTGTFTTLSATGVAYASGGNSNLWNSAYTVATTYQSASGDWQNTFTTVQNNSSNWNSAYQQTSASDLVRSNTTFETPTTGLSTIQNIVSLSLETYNNLTVKLPGTLYVVV